MRQTLPAPHITCAVTCGIVFGSYRPADSYFQSLLLTLIKSSTMARKQRKAKIRRGIKSGLAPGTPVFIGERKREHTHIDIFDFNAESLQEFTDVSLDKCSELATEPTVTWVNINGVHDLEMLEALGKRFNLHPLTLEDIANTTQRPKVEEFPDYLFIVMKMLVFNEENNDIEVEHVSLILGENYVISLLEDEGDVFDTVRERIRSGKGRIRKMKADFLAYSLLDAVVDHYFLAVERIGDVIESIDERVLADPKPADIHEIHELKRDVLKLRKAVWPLREEIGSLDKIESPLLRAETGVFIRDLYDHTIQVIDMVETCRDLLGGMHDTYLSSMSNRMNEVMKMLTVIATIFIPLTFIVGIYGMNFRHMPELEWQWGYYVVWAVMIVIGGGMVVYFKRKKWM